MSCTNQFLVTLTVQTINTKSTTEADPQTGIHPDAPPPDGRHRRGRSTGRAAGQGLTAIQDAVEIYRRLAEANPAGYEPALAAALNNLSIALAEAGRKKESEQASREAAELGTSR